MANSTSPTIIPHAGRVEALPQNFLSNRRRDGALADQIGLLAQVRDAVLVCNLEHVVVYGNESAERLYGWSASLAPCATLTEVMGADPDILQEATRLVRERGEWCGELVHIADDGSEQIIESHWSMVCSDSGQPESILTINSDVTGRKKREAFFLRTQRLESINLLAEGLAEDLHVVLDPILAGLEALKSRYPDIQTRHILDVLEASARRSTAVLDQVRQFARAEKGERCLFNPRQLLREINALAAETLPNDILVRTTIKESLWSISANATQIRQALVNLCVNAREAMPLGGVLSIQAFNVSLNETVAAFSAGAQPGPYLCLEVADNGTGMSGAILEKIFIPCFTTKRAGKAAGLGLSKVLGIVKCHGGFVDVHSEVGKGSTFRVYLPAIPDPHRSGPIDDFPADWPCGNGEVILIVHHEASLRALTGDTLSEFGYRVLTAADGAEACAVLTAHREEIAAVLTDLVLPIMDGPSTIRALREINPELPIVATTRLGASALNTQAREAGACALVESPFSSKTLLTTLRDALQVGA